MKKIACVLTFLNLLFIPLFLKAQGENNQWCFGRNLGMNFNTTPPVFFQTNMEVFEGCASISDNAGNLLFYSSGAYNWDRNGNLMPNGQGLDGNGPLNSGGTLNIGSSASGVAIVHSPSNYNQYYLIVTDAVEDNVYNAHYSVIDMTLNGGLGDVVPTQKNILLTTGISEGVITTTAIGCSGYWAVLHSRFGTEYRAFKIDMNGISLNPVVSNGLTGNQTNASFGFMRFNNSGTRIGRTGMQFEMADFNKSTGVFSSFFTLQPNIGGNPYLEFSSDDSKLYLTSSLGLTQFNLALLPNIAAVQSTQQIIDSLDFHAIRLGPDNKIYLSSLFNNGIHVVNNPNALGTACQLHLNVFSMPSSLLFAEFGNKSPQILPVDTLINTVLDTLICFDQPVTLTAPAGYPSYRWFSNSTGQQETVHEDGAYWVYGISNCQLHIDSFKVRYNNFSFDLGPDTIICKGGQFLLDATTPGATYKWQDNSTGASFTATREGVYNVKVSIGKCSKTDTVKLNEIEPYLYIAEQDTIICKGEPFTLHGAAYPQTAFQWNDGNLTESTIVNEGGTYNLTGTNVCGTFYDSVRIQTMDCFCDDFMPNAFSPNGDSRNDVYKGELNCPGMTGFVLKIFNRFGQCVFESNDVDKVWDGNYNNKHGDVGTYFYYLQYKDYKGATIKKKGDIMLIR